MSSGYEISYGRYWSDFRKLPGKFLVSHLLDCILIGASMCIFLEIGCYAVGLCPFCVVVREFLIRNQ